jgi:hypothetical protein
MPVYVDDLRRTVTSTRWPFPWSCHMAADTLPELHSFALRIGLRVTWFQDGRHPHYDLTTSKRGVAVAYGAQEVSSRGLLRVTQACKAAIDKAKAQRQVGLPYGWAPRRAKS